MNDANTICCPYCDEWQHLDKIDKQELIDEWKFAILECEDCNKIYKAGIDVKTTYLWVIKKIIEEETKEEPQEVNLPGQLFFPFHKS